jgi:hypothetical protein
VEARRLLGAGPDPQRPEAAVNWLRRGEDDDALAEARRPRGCRSCGCTFGSAASWTVHFEAGPGTACLSPDTEFRGQLVDVGGVWIRPGDPVR